MKPSVNPELLATFGALVTTAKAQMRLALKAQGYSLTPPDMKILALLNSHPGMSLQKLVLLTGKDKAQITRKIKELERKNLIARQKDAADQRSYQLFLTPEGKEMQAKTKVIRTEVYQRIFANLTAQQQQEMIKLMRRCLGDESVLTEGSHILV